MVVSRGNIVSQAVLSVSPDLPAMRYKVAVLIFLLIFLSLVLSSPTPSNDTNQILKVTGGGGRRECADLLDNDHFSDCGGQQSTIPVCAVIIGARMFRSIRTASSSRWEGDEG